MNPFVELSPYTKVPANAGTLVVLEEDQIFLLAKSLTFFSAGSFPLRLTLGLFLGFAFRLTFGLFLSLLFGLPLSLFLGFAFRLALGFLFSLTLRLALGLLFSLTLGFLLRLTLRLTLGLFLGFAFRLALRFLFRLFLGFLLYFPLFLFRYATFLRRSFLPRNFPLLRALALRSFFP